MLRRVSARQCRSPTAAMRIVLASGPVRVLHRVGAVAGPVWRLELACVAIALPVGLVQVLLAREQRSAADALGWGRLRLTTLHPVDQFAHHPRRHLLLVAG